MAKNLDQKAMLVRLSISQWTARKYDKKATETVEKEYKAKRGDAGRFNKVLVAQEAIKEIGKVVNAARDYHYSNTLPWADTGYRLLPVTNFDTYSAEMRKHRAFFEDAVSRFVASYPTLVEDARERLNGLFRQEDYPRYVSDKFNFKEDISPIPVGADFRVQLNGEDLQRVQEEIEHRTAAVMKTAHQDLYKRLIEAVSRMAERLTSDGVFRDTLVSNLQELCLLLPALNIEEDEQLERIRKQVEEKLCKFDAQTLRDNSVIKEKTAEDAEAILKALEEIYGSPDGGRKDH
jgi:hypothetical protein